VSQHTEYPCGPEAAGAAITKPPYPGGWAEACQQRGGASSSVAGNGDNAWNVNFNNGNDNNDNKNNDNYVRLVRARECVDVAPVSYRALYAAWTRARRRKKPSVNQGRFEAFWLDRLTELKKAMNTGQWQPHPSVCFVAHRPKAREIHAPDFSDRVVHHWLVPRLEAVWEPLFIHDSYSNRKGKGTHAAVRRVQQFVRQVHSGHGGGWYLQLDIHNFFNSMHRATLYGLLKKRLMTAAVPAVTPSCGTGGLPAGPGGNGGGLSTEFVAEDVSGGSNPPMPAHRPPALQEGRIPRRAMTPEGAVMLRTVHALLRRPAAATGIHYRVGRAEREAVPPHKRLAQAAPGCGLPIGNLSSQFFANVYLNELDQFVKHTLKAKRYVRYVDDFVLVHHDRAQLEAWLPPIEQFLQDRLRLKLKADIRLKPLTAGLDFLGYWIYPTHTLVRPRVIHHAREKLDAWQQRHVRRTANGWRINADAQQQDRLRSVWASYQGHFRHADSLKLQRAFYRRYGWLMRLAPEHCPVFADDPPAVLPSSSRKTGSFDVQPSLSLPDIRKSS
jgi:RNA-directed DNA polymerase